MAADEHHVLIKPPSHETKKETKLKNFEQTPPLKINSVSMEYNLNNLKMENGVALSLVLLTLAFT